MDVNRNHLGEPLPPSRLPAMPHAITWHLMRALSLPITDDGTDDVEGRFDDSLFTVQRQVDSAMQDDNMGMLC